VIVDLFAGPGGWDEGARLAGYTGDLVGLEIDADACATAEAAGHRRIRADVTTYPLGEFAGCDGVIGSPVCTTFSPAGKRAGLGDPKGQLVWEPLRWARELMPRWVALEQVPEVLPIWRIVAAALRELGYDVWTGLVNSADYGVPQNRVRAALAARRDGTPATAPAPTHAQDAAADLFGSELKPWVSMADALGWTADVAYRRTRGAGLIERHGDRPDTPATRPAPTITGKSRSDVWVMTRPATTVLGDPRIGRPGHKARDKGERQFDHGSVRVTVQEAAVLQSFRPDYPWQGSKTSQHQQVGNAVPPLLAAAILRPLFSAGSAGVAA
jgi:DNA (cytosine-5)-methyltransferase 1